MFVYCRDCNWEQDDFYSIDGYNPTRGLETLNKMLLTENLDKGMTINDGKDMIMKREYIARFYDLYAKRIREMKWITLEQFQNDPNKQCPSCGSNNLVVD